MERHHARQRAGIRQPRYRAVSRTVTSNPATSVTVSPSRKPANARAHGITLRSPIRQAILTRRPTSNAASENIYTAIDIETTGLNSATDKIVEIGLVKFTADGTVLDEFSTLINNPGSSRDARDVH